MPELVNQPCQVLKWWPQALMACNCKKDAGVINLICLTGFQNRTVCEHCKKSYYIETVSMTPNGPFLTVNFDLPLPTGIM